MSYKWFEGLGLLVLSAFAVFVFSVIFSVAHSDKLVREYYVAGSGGPSVSCIRADIPWDQDYKVFCSEDINKLLTINKRLNEELLNVRAKRN